MQYTVEHGLGIIQLLSMYDFCTQTKKISNQNAISNKYSILIGQFCSRSTKLVSEKFKDQETRYFLYKLNYCHYIIILAYACSI